MARTAAILTMAGVLCCANASADDMGSLLQSSMVWLESAPTGTATYAAFRKMVAWNEDPGEAKIHIFADTRYLLWVNGRYVDRGPCRFDPIAPEYDTLDVGPFLTRGGNAIVVLVQHCHDGRADDEPGEFCGRAMRHAPCLALVLLTTNGTVAARTNATWRGTTQTEYLPGRLTWAGSMDDVDARRSPGDWTGLIFDDSAWEPAIPVDGAQWGGLQARSVPLLRETPVTPFAVVELGAKPSETAVADALPLTLAEGERVIVDAGKFVQAYAVVDMTAKAGAQIELEFAQSFLSNNRQPGHSWDHVNRYTARDGAQRYTSTDTFGFKYLVIRTASGEATITGISLVNRLYPFDVAGAFECNDAMLTRLWRFGLDTVLACSEDAYVDCATRERVEWLGDGAVGEYPITRAALAGPGPEGSPVYADPRLMRNMLRHIGQSQYDDGRVKAHHPSNRQDIHGYIEDYACLWIHGIRTFCDQARLDPTVPVTDGPERPEYDLARELFPAVTKQIQWFLDRRTERGLVHARDFVFPGNPLCYRECEAVTLNAYVYKALVDGAELARIVGDTGRKSEYTAEAEALRAAINTHLWNESDGTYYGGFEGGKALAPTGHGAMMALYFDVPTGDRVGRVRDWLLARHTEEAVSPYAHMFLFNVLYDMDTDAADQLVLDLVRERWRAMADSETGTVWEGFTPHEWCHNMGAAPTLFLSRYVLGVRVLGPVWENRILIEPRLGDLTAASGVVVTEYGPVPVSWRRDGATLSFECTVPEGVEAEVSLPAVAGKANVIVDDATPDTTVDGRHVRFALGPGRHAGTIAGE
ncbi:MAG: hypothetical protein GY851_09650 [bacterium]|nr:hypothetical protein [bacterium]